MDNAEYIVETWFRLHRVYRGVPETRRTRDTLVGAVRESLTKIAPELATKELVVKVIRTYFEGFQDGENVWWANNGAPNLGHLMSRAVWADVASQAAAKPVSLSNTADEARKLERYHRAVDEYVKKRIKPFRIKYLESVGRERQLARRELDVETIKLVEEAQEIHSGILD